MSGNTSILYTKLAFPLLKNHILKRPSSMKKVKHIVRFPLTLVHAGAGFGKSTTLASLMREEKWLSCWYTVSSHDDDLLPFVCYLVHAVRTALPGFGEKLLDRLSAESAATRDRRSYALCTEFINGLAALEQDLVLAIDDFHLVDHNEAINEFMQLLLEYRPERLHLVVSSRNRPPWQLLPKLKVRDEILEVTEQDLSFSEEEIDVLFNDTYEYPLTAEQVKLVHGVTEGWIIAIQMIWQQLAAGGDLAVLTSRSSVSMNDMFQFMALEVLTKQPEDVRRFLVHTCILDELTASLCDEVLETGNASDILNYLINQRLFLYGLSSGQFRYHSLFREFLLQRLSREAGKDKQLHLRAAEVYERSGSFMQALLHLRKLDESDRIASLIASHGEALLADGRLDTLYELLCSVPEHAKNRYPMVWFVEGEVLRNRCSYELSMECYRQAERIGQSTLQPIVQCRGLEGVARIYLDTIQPGKAEDHLKRAIALLEELPQQDQTADVSKHRQTLYRLMAENLLNAGRTEEAPVWVQKSRMEQQGATIDELEARLHLRTGRLHAVKRLLERGLEAEQQERTFLLSRSHRETDILLSLVESFLGEPEKAKLHAETGMLRGVQRRVPYVEACGWMRMGHAALLLPQYNVQVALNCYRTALDIMEGIDMPRGKAEPLMGLCMLYGLDGAYELAMQHGRAALAETERANDTWLSSFLQLCMAVAALHGGKLDEAAELLERSRYLFTECGDSYGLTLVHMWRSLIAYQLEDDAMFTEAMERFLHTVRSGEFEFVFHRRTLFGPRDVQQLAPLLFEAMKRGIESHYVSYLLAELGIDHMEHHPGYTLRMETLGGFRVRLGERVLDDKDWQRGKAKELFQLLVTKRQQLLAKEDILATLWKQTDEKTATRDFKVALNALNMAIEPGRRARSTPFFIQRHGTSYGLNLASGFELDAVEFESLMKAGLEEKQRTRAKEMLIRGLHLYKGDYMPDRRYDDWCIEERERLQVLFLRGAEKLAQLLVAGEEYDAGIHWCERILQTDPCWEEAYRLLMFCHYHKHNRNQAIKWYNKCVAVLKSELGVEPLQSTNSIYEMVLNAV